MSAAERVTRIDYDAHLASVAWRESPARLAELELSGRRCRICNRGSPEVRIEVHHRTYERFGRERAGDLTTLCGECHRIVTDMLRRRRFATAVLPILVDTPRVLPGREIVATCTRSQPWQND